MAKIIAILIPTSSYFFNTNLDTTHLPIYIGQTNIGINMQLGKIWGVFSSIIGQDSSVPKSDWLHIDNFPFFFTKMRNVLQIPVNGSVIFPRP
jgi:hypothetical protein